MAPEEFRGCNVFMGKDQDEYETLPAFYNSIDGTVTYMIKLEEHERQAVYATGEIFVRQIIWDAPMQPIAFSIRKEDFIPPSE